MKTKLFILVFALIGFFMVGMQSASAQWNIQVDWTDECSGCPGPGGYEYYVCLTIVDICTSQTYGPYCTIKSSASITHTFNVGDFCDIDEHQVCFQVSAVVIKRCIINQTEICRGTDSKKVNCETIYNDEVILVCELES